MWFEDAVGPALKCTRSCAASMKMAVWLNAMPSQHHIWKQLSEYWYIAAVFVIFLTAGMCMHVPHELIVSDKRRFSLFALKALNS